MKSPEVFQWGALSSPPSPFGSAKLEHYAKAAEIEAAEEDEILAKICENENDDTEDVAYNAGP